MRLGTEATSCPTHGSASEAAPYTSALDEHALCAALDLRLEGVLGRGGFGTVYAVARGASSLALKVAHASEDAAARLMREARLLREVGAPYVPAVLDHGVHDQVAFLLLERVAAPTLAARLARGPVASAELDPLARALFTAVGAIHARGIVHLDLKPENVLLEPGRARILDFGSAQHAHEHARDDAIGTAEYMAPEQCDARGAYDQRTDLYALGVLLYELASGAPPFVGTAAEVREAQRAQRPRPLPHAALDAVVRRCLAKDPAQRYEDVSALAAAFAGALATRATPVPQASSPAVSTATASHERRALALVFLRAQASLGAVRARIASAGGQIAHQRGSDYVAVFAHDAGDHPLYTALRAAEQLTPALASRALLDLASVTVQRRADGSERLFSPSFSARASYPADDDPEGVLLTRAAADVLSDLGPRPLAERGDRFRLDPRAHAYELTSFALEQDGPIGREPLLGALRDDALAAFRAQKPALHTVLGEAGLGKTLLARTLAATLAGCELLRFTAREPGANETQLLPELLRRALELPRGAPSATLLAERLGPVLDAQAHTAAAFVLGGLAPQHPDVRKLAAAPGALRTASARAVAHALRRRAESRPLALILDDAQLADDVVLDALELASDEADIPLFVCVFARPALRETRPRWGARAARASHSTLTPLERAAAEQLVRRLLRPIEHLPPSALALLYERTHGIPALLVELVRGLSREGAVRRSERGTAHYLATDALDALPDLPIVAWNVSRELAALPPRLAEHARLASVLGARFTLAELEALVHSLEQHERDQVQLDARVGLERLVEAGIVQPERGHAYAFRHALFCETLYESIPSARRLDLHRAALASYRDAPSLPKRARFALHAARSGERELAAVVYLELAAHAQQAEAYLEAEAAFGHALEQLAEHDARVVAAARGRGAMRFRLGRHEDALIDLRAARARAHEPEQTLQLLLDEATVLDWMRDFVTSAERTREAATLAEAAASELARARLTMSLARVHHRLGDADACVRLGSAAAQHAATLGDEGYETRIVSLLMVAPDCVNLGELAQAERHFATVIAETHARGDLHHLGAAHVNRALLWFARGETRLLFDDLARGAQIARELGAPLIEYPARINMAEVAYAIEELDQAREHTRRALALARSLWGEENRELGMCELLLARIALERGEHAEVRAWIEGIERRIEQACARGLSECAFLPPEQALLEQLRLSVSDAESALWDALEQRCPQLGMQPQEQVAILEARALAARRAGRHDESRAAFQRALALCDASPNLLRERVLRKSRAS